MLVPSQAIDELCRSVLVCAWRLGCIADTSAKPTKPASKRAQAANSRRGHIHQDDCRNVRLARGGMNNLETATEFLQLLVGGERQAAPTNWNAGLELAGLEAVRKRSHLSERCASARMHYRFLRRLDAPTADRLRAQTTGELPDDIALRTARHRPRHLQRVERCRERFVAEVATASGRLVANACVRCSRRL